MSHHRTEDVVPDGRAGSPATDRISVTGISAVGHHGVFDHERTDGQTFVADVVLHVDTRAAAAEDRLDLTADYGVLAEQVVGVLEGDPADLIETVAERIAAVAMTHPGVVAVDVVVHKPQAPVTVPVGDVAVHIHRDLAHPPVVAAPPVVVAVDHLAGAAPGVPDADARGGDLDLDLDLARDVEDDGILAADPLHTAGAGEADLLSQDQPTAAFAAVPGGAHTMPVSDLDGRPADASDSLAAGGAPRGDRLDRRPAEPVDVVLALGSNVGSSHETLRQVVLDLAAVPGLEILQVAPLARTGAVGGPEQPDFLNTVVLGRTTLSPRALLHACQRIEDDHGRVREERWGPRTIDIDLIVHGTTVDSAEDLELPHPRAHERAFVLEPWAQVDPGAVLPGLGGGPVAVLAGTAPDRGGIRWMALDWWAAPEAGDR